MNTYLNEEGLEPANDQHLSKKVTGPKNATYSQLDLFSKRTGPKVIKLFSCSTQPRMKFVLPIKN